MTVPPPYKIAILAYWRAQVSCIILPPRALCSKHKSSSGFTLIELSIVLVVIALLVGGVLVGQDLVRAAEVRATVSQIEKYQSATNTFRDKYGYLPGDINAAAAAQFGFAARGPYAGQGDGNGLIEGNFFGLPGGNAGAYALCGEQGMFWVDVSKAGLIEGSFNPIAYAGNAWWNCGTMSAVSSTAIASYLPVAKLGNGNYIYVWSGGVAKQDGKNYFELAKVIGGEANSGVPQNFMGLTVKQAYNIDKKIDDGLPQSGRIMATFVSNRFAWASTLANYNPAPVGASGLANYSTFYAPVTNPGSATGDSASSTTCYDYVQAATLPVVYSVGGNISPNNSSRVNCVLSFQFQ